MWVLENEGDILNGKKLWLPPGKKFLFGRTKPDNGEDNFVVSDKTISRKHLTIQVDSVGPNDCPNTRSRSRVTLTDLGTKIGTVVNEKQIKGESYVLEADKNTITLGRYQPRFLITWIPVVFTFSFTAKEHKADPYRDLFKLFGPLDIKVLVEYEHGITTHVVAKKRNTSKGLQALIDGKCIVYNDTWTEAVIAATTPGDDGGASLLEQDFEANFPNPSKFLPPKGDEPTEREDEVYASDPRRQDMFEGYTFIFYSKPQFDNLSAPISLGSGKALLREVVPKQTTVDEFVRYVKTVAGEKGLGSFDDGSEGKGVAVVRFNPVKGVGTEWYREFSRDVALHLDHRLIEQNEFLDAILGNDASVLRRPLEVEQSEVSAPPPTAAVVVSEVPQSSQMAPPAATQAESMGPPELPRRGRARRTARPKFTGFDDDFADIPTPSSIPAPEPMHVDPPHVEESQPSQGLFVSQDPEMMAELEPSQMSGTQTRTSRKRKASPIFVDLEEEEDVMERLAPTAAAMKRRRIAEDAERRRRGETTPPPASVPILKSEPEPEPPKPEPEAKPKGRKKKQEPQNEVLEAARLQREAEALAKAERENLEEQLQDMSIEEIRRRVEIQEMPVIRRERRSRPVQADESDRWDDKWNGRKNFKKFRRQGVDNTRGRRNQEKVIVQLEVVKTRDYGIGDEYWDQGDSQRKKRRDKGKGKESQEMESQPSNRAARRAAEILAREELDEEPVGDFDDGTINTKLESSDLDIVAPPSRAAKKLVDKTRASQNQSPAKSSSKRMAQTVLTKPAPMKKQKMLGLAGRSAKDESEEDSDDDDMKFRFKKRK